MPNILFIITGITLLVTLFLYIYLLKLKKKIKKLKKDDETIKKLLSM